MLHALLIDDETAARADLRGKLAAHAGVTVVGEAATVSAARTLLTSADYNLVFLDVQLVGGEAFALIPDVRPGAAIVFATAHDRYAVRAFESNALDFLLKPIASARLGEALRRAAAHAARRPRTHPSAVGAFPHRTASPNAAVRVAVNLLTTAPEDTTEVALTDDERVFLRQCLEAWEDSLPPLHILRAPGAQTIRYRRTVRYERDTEPTRLFLAGTSTSRFRRWWRTVRAHLAW